VVHDSTGVGTSTRRTSAERAVTNDHVRLCFRTIAISASKYDRCTVIIAFGHCLALTCADNGHTSFRNLEASGSSLQKLIVFSNEFTNNVTTDVY